MSTGERRGERRPNRQREISAAPATVGQRLRAERERQRIGLRELSRRVNVSASLISQIELGRASPSVGTLSAIVNELQVSLDELFSNAGDAPRAERGGVDHGDRPARPAHARADAAPRAAGEEQADAPAEAMPLVGAGDGALPVASAPVVRREERQSIHLGSGVTWERMADADHGVDFLYVVYEVGGGSAAGRSLIRHPGREYGHVLEGRLGVTVGFDTYELEPGDAISFDSTTPHRLFNLGDTPARAVWCVVGRENPRVPPATDAVGLQPGSG